VARSTTSVRRTVQRIRIRDISKIVPANREATVKALVGSALLIAAIAWATPALSEVLLTGVVRDHDGRAVPAVMVRAFDAGGLLIGKSTGARDGTFSFDVAGTPASVVIDCTYCESERVAVRADEPVVAIVRRYAALRDRTPSPADLAAVPYHELGDVASLAPYVIATSTGISDRGLDRGRGAVLINGVPFYGFFDGSDAALTIPAYAQTSLVERSPLAAPSYGAYANGGMFAVGTDAGPSRVDGGGASDVILRASGDSVRGAYDVSDGPAGHRTLVSGGATAPVAGGTLDVTAIALSAVPTTASGALVSYDTSSRRYETGASFETTESANTISSSTIDQSDVRGDFHVRSRGPLGLEFGYRIRRSTGVQLAGPFSNGGAQHEEALYVDGGTSNDRSSFSFSAAMQRDGARIQTSALIASLGYDVALDPSWTLHAGAGNNVRPLSLGELESVGAPFIDRSSFSEVSLQFSDNRRIRLETMGYIENIDGPTDAHDGGIGFDGAWQIAPHFALRAWMLRSIALQSAPYVLQPQPLQPVTRLNGNLVWLTYEPNDGGMRFDAINRGRALEGDMVLPLARGVAAVFGSQTRNGTRITTFGLQLP